MSVAGAVAKKIMRLGRELLALNCQAAAIRTSTPTPAAGRIDLMTVSAARWAEAGV